MRNRALRSSVLLLALTLPLGGCLEVAGTKFNRGPSVAPASLCPPGARSGGKTIGYGCPPPAAPS